MLDKTEFSLFYPVIMLETLLSAGHTFLVE